MCVYVCVCVYVYINIYREEEEVSYRKIFEDLGITVPAEYICSITMEIMSDPVLLILGHMCGLGSV